jgi:glutaredoxin-like YruB-family protein
MAKFFVCFFSIFMVISGTTCYAADASMPQQSIINPIETETLVHPVIVLYSTSWCSHCKRTKEYFKKNNIPFINRDVELDSEAMDTLLNKYDTDAVPVIVIGNDDIILKGFKQDEFEKALTDYKLKHKNSAP